jgi:hypothetical protein
MYNAFVSVVCVLSRPFGETGENLGDMLENLAYACAGTFKDYEIVLVENGAGPELNLAAERISEQCRRNISVVTLCAAVEESHAIMAGLDRAYGDYVVLLRHSSFRHPEIVEKLYVESQKGSDIVYLHSRERNLPPRIRVFYSVFYGVFNYFSKNKIDPNMRTDRIFSRRALGWILRLREHTRFSKALFTNSGFNAKPYEIDFEYEEDNHSLPSLIRDGFAVLASQTPFLQRLLEVGLVASTIFLITVIVNALLVRFSGVDIFLNPQENVPGWTFLVVFSSVMWIWLNGVLYVLSTHIQNVYNEVRDRPLYIIENLRKL